MVAGERRIASLGDVLLACGETLPVEVAYQTWGSPQNPAVLICHAISGDSNAAAWWSRLVGEGKAFDPTTHFLICSNVIGGCQGTTGPSSMAIDGKPYGSRFPAVTVGDFVTVQRRLLDHLGGDSLAMVAGGSMGGMQALEWASRFPDRVERVWVTASALAHGAMQIGFNEVARQSILRDPKWRGGDYPPDDPPAHGLSVGRMAGHLTYLSDAAFTAKFGREVQADEKGAPAPGWPKFLQRQAFAVESYLRYQGDKFVQRFDPNSLLILSNAIDTYQADLSRARARFLVTSFTSDWIYPSHLSQAIHEAALAAGCESQWVDIDLPLGHDAFLLDDVHQAALVRDFLNRP